MDVYTRKLFKMQVLPKSRALAYRLHDIIENLEISINNERRNINDHSTGQSSFAK
jgi:hypothetical protein